MKQERTDVWFEAVYPRYQENVKKKYDHKSFKARGSQSKQSDQPWTFIEKFVVRAHLAHCPSTSCLVNNSQKMWWVLNTYVIAAPGMINLSWRTVCLEIVLPTDFIRGMVILKFRESDDKMKSPKPYSERVSEAFSCRHFGRRVDCT